MMLEYDVVAKRTDAHGSVARCKDAEVRLDTDVNGRKDAFNPAELFLAAIAACMIKGIEALRRCSIFNFAASKSAFTVSVRTVRPSYRRFRTS
jgi:organic hydroperoxide reductase OsmC/OhrA